MYRMPGQVWLLTLCYALMLCGTSMVVLIAGIIGATLAPNEDLATLPVALSIVGVALNTLPVSYLMSQFGRKTVFLLYACIAISSGLLASWSLTQQSFFWFCIAALGIGSAAAAVQQYRFAAIEYVTEEHIPKAASTILLGGILAAFLGPEITLLGRHLLATEYAGSFVLLSCIYGIGFLLLMLSRPSQLVPAEDTHQGRPFSSIIRQQDLIIAVSAAAVAYGVMSFIMTATPLSMHTHHGHSLSDTKWVIQSHVAAMYLPSLFSGILIERLGHYRMMWMGLFAFLACLIVAYTSQAFWAFWAALIFLGIGWNFLFVAGTALLATTYRNSEKFKIQAFNDFTVFSIQAIAALSSGWLLFSFRWQGILLISLIPLLIIVFMMLISRHSTSAAAAK